MKPNEIVLTILQLSAPIFCFAVGYNVQGWFLVTWIIWFGLAELVAKKRTGKTLSQHVWAKPMWKRVVLSVLMIGGMMALGFHFIWG